MRLFRTTILLAAIAAAPVSASAATMFLSSGKSLLRQGRTTDYSKQPGVYEERFNRNSGGDVSICAPNHATSVMLGTDILGAGGAGALTSIALAGSALPPGMNAASAISGVDRGNESCYLSAPSPTLADIGAGVSVDVDFTG